MNVVATRLVFLAFIGLCGFIIYNSLYMQEQRNAAVSPRPMVQIHAAPVPALKPAVADLPPLPEQVTSRQLVTAVQRELAARGYGAGPATGKLSDETRKAIAAFEKDHGLRVTGAPSDELLRHILLGEAARPGSSTGSVGSASSVPQAKPGPTPSDASTVKQVQQILADLGYDPGAVDGTMGEETERAVSAFQRDRKIAQNGRITPELLREIKRVTGRDLSGGTPRP